VQTVATSVITNPNTGAITIVTKTMIVQSHFHYGLLALAIVAAGLIAAGLRMLFWQKNSN